MTEVFENNRRLMSQPDWYFFIIIEINWPAPFTTPKSMLQAWAI